MTARIITDLDEARAVTDGCSCGYPSTPCVRCSTGHDDIAASLVRALERVAELTAALRRYVSHCDTCGMVATWQGHEHEPDVDGIHECDACHAAGEDDCVTEMPHAAVLRSLNGAPT